MAATHELRRAIRPGGYCVAVTNGEMHFRSLRQVLEDVVREDVPQWRIRSESMQSFSLENGAESLSAAFESVTCVRPDRPPRARSGMQVLPPAMSPAWRIPTLTKPLSLGLRWSRECAGACSWSSTLKGRSRSWAPRARSFVAERSLADGRTIGSQQARRGAGAMRPAWPACRRCSGRERRLTLHLAGASRFSPIARRAYEDLNLAWPEPFEAAVRSYLQRELDLTFA